MGASNSRAQAPFLTYLTVFKARLAAINLVLAITSLAYQPLATLRRRLRARLSESTPLSLADTSNWPTFQYLVGKKLLGTGKRARGRYLDRTLWIKDGRWHAASSGGGVAASLPVFCTDIWMSGPDIRSTIGVPTPDNADELIELCTQLGVLTTSKNTWTAAGQLASGLRGASGVASSNPLRLGLEGVAFLRQVFERDGVLLRELLRDLVAVEGLVSRDSMALRLPEIAARALGVAKSLGLSPPVLAAGKQFVSQLRAAAVKRNASSRAPGVLEHRISPRLEWLVDFGALTKEHLPKNGFEYRVTDDAAVLLRCVSGNGRDAMLSDEGALAYWRESTHWADLRKELPRLELRSAITSGYRLMRRVVGPAPIREVSFAAATLLPSATHTVTGLARALVDWAATDRRITVSGGRYSRSPELVYMPDDILRGER